MRNTYKADEVVLIGEGYGTGSGACGIAWLMSGNNPSFAPNAYAVVDRTCATGYYSFGHEMGHNMGLNHARDRPRRHRAPTRTPSATRTRATLSAP